MVPTAAIPAAAASLLLLVVAAQASTTAHIAVKPRSVMVDKAATLTGSGFAANSSVQLQECGATMWIVPQEPCDTANEITVAVNSAGRFKASIKVLLCPRELPPTLPVTQESCYIGAPQPTGLDTVSLTGAAKITVTYP